MSVRDPLARIGPTVAVLVAALAGVGAVLQVRSLDGAVTVGDRVAPFLFVLYAVVAGVLTARRPRLVIGWLLLAFAGLMTVGGAGSVAVGALATRSQPLADVAAWLQAWTWLLGILVLAVALSLFPDGRLPSPRWRAVAAVHAVGIVLACAVAVALWPERGPALLDAGDQWPGAAGVIGAVALPVTLVGFVAALVSLVVRFRTATQLVRLQLKWLLLAVSLLVAALVLAAVADLLGYGDRWWQDLFGLSGLLLLPVAIAAAVLRYRLFEIDHIISRTVAWVLVTGALAGMYVLAVLGLGALLPDGGNDLVVALSTLAVAASFQPLRGRVQRAVDHRFDRARYDAGRTIESFGRSLRDEVSRDAVVDGLRRRAAGTFGATAVGVLLVGEERR